MVKRMLSVAAIISFTTSHESFNKVSGVVGPWLIAPNLRPSSSYKHPSFSQKQTKCSKTCSTFAVKVLYTGDATHETHGSQTGNNRCTYPASFSMLGSQQGLAHSLLLEGEQSDPLHLPLGAPVLHQVGLLRDSRATWHAEEDLTVQILP
jgi:hypothetical protein